MGSPGVFRDHGIRAGRWAIRGNAPALAQEIDVTEPSTDATSMRPPTPTNTAPITRPIRTCWAIRFSPLPRASPARRQCDQRGHGAHLRPISSCLRRTLPAGAYDVRTHKCCQPRIRDLTHRAGGFRGEGTAEPESALRLGDRDENGGHDRDRGGIPLAGRRAASDDAPEIIMDCRSLHPPLQ
jgi:hypothetical protein